MAQFNIWMLGESNLTVSGNEELSGYIQGDGSHLVGETITFTSKSWTETTIKDNDSGFGEDEDIQRLHGDTTIDGVTYSHNSIVEAEYIITVTDPDGNSYSFIGYNINEPNSPYDTYGTVEGLALIGPNVPPTGVPLTVVSATDGPSNGIDIPAGDIFTPPCFTPGTMIMTPKGPRAVETLEVGDMVMTRDNGRQPILWIGSVDVPAARLLTDTRFRPILLRKNALGPDMPNRDMHLSPQHRVLIRDERAEMFFGANEVLVAAKHLIDDRNILVDHLAQDVTYMHLYCADHQILIADGLEAESFRPGKVGLEALSEDARDEFLELFPEFDDDTELETNACRPMLKAWETAILRRATA